MTLGETESGVFGLLANEPADVFEPMGAALECLGAGCIQDRPGMFSDEPTQPHDRAQRLWTARIECALRPLSALLTQYRRSADPITARGKNRGAESTRSEAVTELAGLLASVHPNLFHAFIEDPHAAAIPAYPDFAANQFRWRLVKGSFDFHVAVAMNAAPAFLEAGKKQAGSGCRCGRSSSKQAATCLHVVPWMRVSATLLSQQLRKRFSSARDLKRRPLSA